MLSSPDIYCERRRLSDLEVGSGISGKPLAEVASEEKRRVGRERKRDGGEGENLASSPHASLNRPMWPMAKSHQS